MVKRKSVLLLFCHTTYAQTVCASTEELLGDCCESTHLALRDYTITDAKEVVFK